MLAIPISFSLVGYKRDIGGMASDKSPAQVVAVSYLHCTRLY